MTSKYVPGHGSIGASLFILGESPSYVEVEAGLPFVGPSGKELDRLLKDAGINRGDCWISNVCKYFVPPSSNDEKIPFQVRATRHGINMEQQLQELQSEINDINPNCILALGKTALWALTGKNKIGNYRGSILQGMGHKVVATYHPAHLLHQASGEFKGYWNRQVMIFDMKRALAESKYPELVLPSRHLTVCRNSAQLAEFISRGEKYDRVSVDIEALDCIPTCIGLAFTPHEGISVPLWNSKGISHIPDSDLVSIWILLAGLLSSKNIVGQNFKYDQDKLRRLGFNIKRLVSDTMLKAFAINPELPKSLAFNTSIYTREPYYKDEGSEFDIKKQSIDDLFKYNAKDACITIEVDSGMDADLDELGMRPYYENFILPLHELYLGIENEGFYINPETRNKLLEKYIKWDESIRYELFNLVGDEINVNSPTQIKILLFQTLKLPIRPTTGEEDLTALLNIQKGGVKTEEQRRIVELILEGRRVRKTISTYLTALPDFDGKMKTTYYLCLETGRTATGQLEPPIRPMIDVLDENNKRKKKAIGTAFQTITKHGDIGQDIRSMYVPDKGHVFLQADSAQAEARVVFLLANDEQALRDIDEHDYHALTASWFFGGTEDDYSKRKLGYESPIRFAGKTLRHAGHLGAGKRRAATELNTQARKYKIPIQITEAIADKALKIFHQKQPKIQQVFHGDIIKCLERGRRLVAPVPYGINAKTGGVRTFFERWGDELFRQAFSYIPQRAVSDSTKGAALRLKANYPNLRIILEAHDGLLFMVPENEAEYWARIIKIEMERPIRFDTCSVPRRDLIIPCEIEIGYNYQELSKFKFVVKEIA